MRKLTTLILSTFAMLAFAGQVFAGTMNIKLEAPKSPTNLTSLNVTFVVLDYASNGAITAKCYKKSPTDGGFSQFGSDIAISTGGNTANCVADSSILNADGTYQFYVTAANASETVTSDTVSVERKTTGPGTPTNYGKSRVNTCDYKISFKTADDGGKTVKVEVYRSGQTSFTADNGSRVDTITIGSNTDGLSTTTPPTCNQDYYFAVRAFDSTGNGSGLVGDSVTVTVGSTTTTTTTVSGGSAAGASGTAGAIPAGTNGNVLGTSNGALTGSTGPSGGVLGEASVSGTPTPAETPTPPKAPTLFTGRNVGIGGGLLVIILLLIFLFK